MEKNPKTNCNSQSDSLYDKTEMAAINETINRYDLVNGKK